MQTTNHNNGSLVGSQQTIIQVAKNSNSNTATIIQNGQHLLIGKIENQSGSTANSNNMQSIYPLQYIETAVANSNVNQANSDGTNNNNNTALYGTGGQKIFYQDSNHSSIYTMSGQSATIIPASSIQARDLSNQLGGGGGGSVGSAVHIQATPHAQIVHHGGNAYLVQSTARMEDESPNMSHTTKASPVTVQWLCDNYETADGVSLPRSTLYNHYLQHCQQEKLEPMNQASFGKLIRSVFFGLRTRRLGTRGNSKYHYYGIRIKPNSVLNHYVEDQTFAMRQYPSFHRQNQDNNDLHWRNRYSSNSSVVNYGSNNVGGGNNGCLSLNNMGGSGELNPNQHSSFLGESTSALPNLSEIMTRAELDSVSEEQCAAEGVTLEDIGLFCQMYYDHSDAVLSSVVYLNFKFIESLWQDFWRTPGPKMAPTVSSVSSSVAQMEEKLSKVQLQRLLRLQPVQNFMQLFDNMFYQSLVEVLIPNVLRPIPSALTQNIRHFAKSLEGWMSTATAGLPRPVVDIKMSCVCALAQTLRRHTSLNHLAQAARAVLKNANQISQMLGDLNRVDFSNVQEQASWVCGCDGKRVDALQQDFKRILQQQASLEEWASWLDNVVSDALEPYKGSPRYPRAAHQLILKWSFYSSMVIRDLTLRSAASFGSFHLIRLLYDEYVYYLVEQKVAEHLNLTPVAVTGDMGRQLMSSEYSHNHNMMSPMEDLKTKFKSEQLPIGCKKDLIAVDHAGGVPMDTVDYRVSAAAAVSNNNIQGPESYSVPLQTIAVPSSTIMMADEQVDESADDDEGLDEEECQINEQLSSGTSRQFSSSIMAAAGHKADTMVTVRTNQHSVTPPPPPPPIIISQTLPLATVLGNSNSNNSVTSSARKTVNVTTFGEPPSHSLSSMTTNIINNNDSLTTTTTTTATITANKMKVSSSSSPPPLLTTVLCASAASSASASASASALSAVTLPSIITTTNISSTLSTINNNKRIKLLNNHPLSINNNTNIVAASTSCSSTSSSSSLSS